VEWVFVILGLILLEQGAQTMACQDCPHPPTALALRAEFTPLS
jgi:hypothetical protein